MRSVFVFPVGEPTDTVALLDRYLPQQRGPWTLDGNVYIEIDDQPMSWLVPGWEPDELAGLDEAVGHAPGWAVQIDISGRIDGTAEVRRLVALLLEQGGVAVDDYSVHPWALAEIESRAVIDGLRFFDFRTYHERRRGN